ncbi:MAG: CopD family protein [Burkholderiales bacterium]|nr:CopD family protein [Burkholderiales bacterium]
MPWLKLLHVTAVIVWCGALLYLSALFVTVAGARSSDTAGASSGRWLLRAFYTGVATPAALVAISSGTWLFATQGPLAPWLMIKLALVSLLVLGHGACGMLVLRSERHQYDGLGIAGRVVTATTLLWLVGIAALVLGKPVWP